MSRVALFSCYTADYRPLADKTFNQNKALYCARYGYTGYNYECGLHKQGFTKFKMALSILDHHEWVWITGTDSLITNFTKDVYDVLDLSCDRYSFIGAYDANGLNADSVLFRNDTVGRCLLEMVLYNEDVQDNEQHTTVLLLEQNPCFGQRAKITYQWELNSYDYNLYPGCPQVDSKYQARGQWQEGDLLIHWPGVGYDKRMELANHYLDRVIR